MVDSAAALALDILVSGDSQSDLMLPITAGHHDGPAPDRASEAIIRSKVRAPVLRESTLTRQRLLDWMDQHAEERVRVLAAEAGFGKTTLLADWARRTAVGVRWLRLDPPDAEWATLISYLVAAFQESDPSFGVATLNLLGHVATLGVTRDQATSQLIAELDDAVIEPTVLIIDDIQHVQGNADIRAILERLVERSPEDLTFVFSGRGRLTLGLGRQTAQGNVATLGTDALRFTHAETGDLFRTGYRIPLDGELVAVVESRTEGWAASLQLISSSLRGQRTAEVRDFIRTLEGSQGPLYDFLAEEVLGRQPVEMQQILLHAAILDRIVPTWVVAALSVVEPSPDAAYVSHAIELADELGLMSRSAEQSVSRRFHPLLREFLASHLRATTPPDTIRLMHLRVAEAAEPTHWPTSAHHYIEAGEGDHAMRVIGDATIVVTGTGSTGVALRLIERLPHTEPTPAVKAIIARGLARRGHHESAVALLESVAIDKVGTGQDRAILRLALAHILSHTSRDLEVEAVLRLVVIDDEAPQLLRLMARAWMDMVGRGHLESLESMQALLTVLRFDRLHLYSGLAHHNLSLVQLVQADYRAAMDSARQAIQLLTTVDDDEGGVASAEMVIAHAQFESGYFDDALAHARHAASLATAEPDVFAEAASLQVWLGQLDEAAASVETGWVLQSAGTSTASVADGLLCASSIVSLARGDFDGAADKAFAARTPLGEHNQVGLTLLLRAIIALAPPDAHNAAAAQAAITELTNRGMRRWAPHVRLLTSIAHGRSADVDAFFANPAPDSERVLLVVADALASTIRNMDDVPPMLNDIVRRWPDRWRPVLRLAVTTSGAGHGFAAAAMLSDIGESDDIQLLRNWERRQRKWIRDARFSDSLAVRVSPTLVVHDLGRTELVIGSRHLAISGVRRRAASLLLYLISRPRHMATREQVLDALWPDQDPTAAGNSLHQTLFFLRRELVARSREVRPQVEYVPVEADIVRIVPELVHVDSSAFLRQATDLASRSPGLAEALALIQSYVGPFAPEFEYEEWAIAWRDHVHTAFLHLVEQAARVRLPDRPAEATAILRHALEADPTAIELKPLLVVATYYAGSHAAASLLHRQYASEVEREFGEAPASLQELLQAFGTG